MIWLKGQSGIAWAEFDAGWYLARYPEVRLVVSPDRPDEVLRFYLITGQQIGHSPNRYFDEAWYLEQYPDAASMVHEGRFASGFDEYCQTGSRGRSPHWLYYDIRYRLDHQRASGRELNAAVLQAAGCADAYDHYLRQGSQQGRIAHPMLDPAYYRAQLDPAEAKSVDEVGAFRHYLSRIETIEAEPRPSIYFDPVWYRQRYPAIAAELGSTWLSGLHHYLAARNPTGFDPLPQFSEAFYLARNPDVAATVAAGNPRNGYRHFLSNGVFELRAPSEAIDLRQYVNDHPQVRVDIEAGRVRDAFAHRLQFGASPSRA